MENNAQISFSPQSVNNLPRYELVTSPEYRAFIEKVIQLKKQGAPILGSLSYFKTLLDQTPYECYPTLVPRILPDGWLAYPCRPMEKAGGEQGGRVVNLLSVNTWDEAWSIAKAKYGEAPTSCVSCFQQCYAEPSLMQARPLEYLRNNYAGMNSLPMLPDKSKGEDVQMCRSAKGFVSMKHGTSSGQDMRFENLYYHTNTTHKTSATFEPLYLCPFPS